MCTGAWTGARDFFLNGELSANICRFCSEWMILICAISLTFTDSHSHRFITTWPPNTQRQRPCTTIWHWVYWESCSTKSSIRVGQINMEPNWWSSRVIPIKERRSFMSQCEFLASSIPTRLLAFRILYRRSLATIKVWPSNTWETAFQMSFSLFFNWKSSRG